jgi:hypothetical protein
LTLSEKMRTVCDFKKWWKLLIIKSHEDQFNTHKDRPVPCGS